MRRVDRRLDALLEVQKRGEGSEAVPPHATPSTREKKCKVVKGQSAKSVQYKDEDVEFRDAGSLCIVPAAPGKQQQEEKDVPPQFATQDSRHTVRPSNKSGINGTPSLRQRIEEESKLQRLLAAQRRSAERQSTGTIRSTVTARPNRVSIYAARRSGLPWARKLAEHDWFDYIISSFLVLNALIIGFEVQWNALGREQPLTIRVLEIVCSFVFLMELALRILGLGRDFCSHSQRFWAVCDTALVILSIVAFILELSAGASGTSGIENMGKTGRLLKILRMFRVLRLLRMVRFLSELRVMANMIINSMFSLFWLFTLLLILIYMFAIVLTMGATEFLDANKDGVVQERYGTLFGTMYTLFQAMSGGVSWGDVTTPLMKVGPLYFFVSLVFIFFCIFSVLNIVTGVFVDGAIELAKHDRSMIVVKQAQSRDASASHLMEILREMDSDEDCTISKTEFNESLKRDDIRQYMDAMSVDTTEAELLFLLLDRDGDGSVDIEEFVEGMQRLKGEAKSFDVHMLMHANRQVLRVCSSVCDLLAEHQDKILIPEHPL